MLPFRHNPKLAMRNKRLHRLKVAGRLPATDKASLRQSAAEAAASHPAIIIRPGKRTRADYDAG